MFGRTEAEKQAAAADQARRESESAASETAKAEARAAAAHAASPVRRAEAALQRGDHFFQIRLLVASLEGDPSHFGWTDNRLVAANRPRTDGKPDVLTQIEQVGWHLEHVGYVFVHKGSTSSSRILSTGEGTMVEGSIEGVYLFRVAIP